MGRASITWLAFRTVNWRVCTSLSKRIWLSPCQRWVRALTFTSLGTHSRPWRQLLIILPFWHQDWTRSWLILGVSTNKLGRWQGPSIISEISVMPSTTNLHLSLALPISQNCKQRQILTAQGLQLWCAANKCHRISLKLKDSHLSQKNKWNTTCQSSFKKLIGKTKKQRNQ